MFSVEGLAINSVYEAYDSKGKRVTLRLEAKICVLDPEVHYEFYCRSIKTHRPVRISDVRQFIKLVEDSKRVSGKPFRPRTKGEGRKR